MKLLNDGTHHIDPSTRYHLSESVVVTQLFPPYPPGSIGFGSRKGLNPDLVVSKDDAVKVRAMISSNPDKKMGVDHLPDNRLKLFAISATDLPIAEAAIKRKR